MILRPPQTAGDPNESRRRMMAQLLAGGPMPTQAAQNPATAMSGGIQQAMRSPEFMKWLGSLMPQAGSAPMSMGPFFNPATGQGS